MSVLKLRRDMVVAEEEKAARDAAADNSVGRNASDKNAVVEIEKPFPLRTIEPDPNTIDGEIAEFVEHADNDHEHEREPKSFFQVVRFWFNAFVIFAALAAYPAMVVFSSDVGDRDLAGNVDRTAWSSPWAGAASTLMEKHFDELGWASDQPAWAPMARLTAKPAYQAAMAGALGAFIKIENQQAVADGRPDPDLEAAARLVSETSTGIQLRAARDALASYDHRMHRRDSAEPAPTPAELAAQVSLMISWAKASQEKLAVTAETAGGNPIDETATRAVYTAKGQAMVAFLMLDAMRWPQAPGAADARNAAMKAWKAAAEFHPLIVLNGDPDGSIFGNHAASMGFLVGQAQKATEEFLKAVTPAPAAPVVAVAAPVVEPALVAEPEAAVAPPAKAAKAPVKGKAPAAAKTKPAVK